MKQLIIVCEGQTEQEFCKEVLYEHFFMQGIILHPPLIKKSKGGIVAWPVLKREIETHLKSSPYTFVSTLIDFYGLNDKHQIPQWEQSKTKPSVPERASHLEIAMQADIQASIRHRFIPYMQMYEFEALLFSDAEIFNSQFQKDEILDAPYLQATLQIPPEEINDGTKTAPSKRLQRIIKAYHKTIYGALLAQAIGLKRIREQCPRFNEWINRLENIHQ